MSRNDRLALGSAVTEVCRAPAGWRVALAAELVAAGMRPRGAVHPREFYYHNQAGRQWDMDDWGIEVRRAWFVTADWETLDPKDGGAVHASTQEGHLVPYCHPSFCTAAKLRAQLPTGRFCGVVFVRDGAHFRHVSNVH